MSEERRYTYLPAYLADKVEAETSVKGIEKEILSYIEETRQDFRVSIESIDEDVLLYRAKMITARNAFREAKDAELEASYKLWEDFNKEIKNTRAYIKEAKDVVKELTDEVKSLNYAIGALDKHRAEDFLTTLTKITALCKHDRELIQQVVRLFPGDQND